MLLFQVPEKQDCSIDDDCEISVVLEEIWGLCFPSYWGISENGTQKKQDLFCN